VEIRRGYVEVDGRQVHYREAGVETAPTVLLLHQSPSHSAMYDALMRELGDRYHLIAPDNPGFGGSDPLLPGTVTIAAYATVIDGFLTALDIVPDFVFGHHTGASIAVQWAHDFPGRARAMALSGPPLLDDALRASLPSMAEPFPETADGAHVASMWQRIRGKDEEAPLAITLRETLSALACGDSYLDSYRAVAAQDFESLLPSINIPVLVFASEADILFEAVAPTVAALPRGERGTLGVAARTYVCEREADKVAALLHQFYVRQREVAGGS